MVQRRSRCGLNTSHVAAEESAKANRDPAASALPAARGGGCREFDRVQYGAAAVDGHCAHEHGIAETGERSGGAIDEMDGGDALSDELFDEIAAQGQRGTETVERFVVELREQMQMVASAHPGEDGNETAIRRGECGKDGRPELATELVTKLGKEAMVALLVLEGLRGAGVLIQSVGSGLVRRERYFRDEAVTLFLCAAAVVAKVAARVRAEAVQEALIAGVEMQLVALGPDLRLAPDL